MDPITKALHSHLVKMAYEGATHEQEHQMQHLMALLEPEDEETVLHYYGLLGHERLALDEIAAMRGESPEETMAAIDRLVRKIAITPEWQSVCGD